MKTRGRPGLIPVKRRMLTQTPPYQHRSIGWYTSRAKEGKALSWVARTQSYGITSSTVNWVGHVWNFERRYNFGTVGCEFSWPQRK